MDKPEISAATKRMAKILGAEFVQHDRWSISEDKPMNKDECATHGTPFISPGICPFCDAADRAPNLREAVAAEIRNYGSHYGIGEATALDMADRVLAMLRASPPVSTDTERRVCTNGDVKAEMGPGLTQVSTDGLVERLLLDLRDLGTEGDRDVPQMKELRDEAHDIFLRVRATLADRDATIGQVLEDEWLKVRSRFNELHGEGAISYDVLKSVTNAVSKYRDDVVEALESQP